MTTTEARYHHGDLPTALLAAVEQIIEDKKALQRQLDEMILESSVARLEPLLASATDLNGFKLIAALSIRFGWHRKTRFRRPLRLSALLVK